VGKFGGMGVDGEGKLLVDNQKNLGEIERILKILGFF
jgi:hypothetical protein